MTDLTIRVDLGQKLRDLATLYPDTVREESEAVLKLIGMRVEKEVVELTPRGVGAQGGLAGSIHHVVSMSAGSGKVEIGTPFAYGEVIELGRRPGTMPPSAPIALWAMRKLGISAKDAPSVGFAIALKIKEKGFEGAHMFERTLDKLDPWIMAQLSTIPERVARKLNE